MRWPDPTVIYLTRRVNTSVKKPSAKYSSNVFHPDESDRFWNIS